MIPAYSPTDFEQVEKRLEEQAKDLDRKQAELDRQKAELEQKKAEKTALLQKAREYKKLISKMPPELFEMLKETNNAPEAILEPEPCPEPELEQGEVGTSAPADKAGADLGLTKFQRVKELLTKEGNKPHTVSAIATRLGISKTAVAPAFYGPNGHEFDSAKVPDLGKITAWWLRSLPRGNTAIVGNDELIRLKEMRSSIILEGNEVSLANAGPAQTLKSDGNKSDKANLAGKGNVRLAVEDAIDRAPAEFSILNVMNVIKKRGHDLIKKKSVKGILRKLRDDGLLEEVKPGAGRRPSTYRKANQ